MVVTKATTRTAAAQPTLLEVEVLGRAAKLIFYKNLDAATLLYPAVTTEASEV